MSEKKLLGKGSALSAVVLFSRIAISFFLMPFVIRMLGERLYGLWLLIATFAGYYGMLDFGISGATLRFVSRELGAGRRNNVKYYVNSAFFVLCGFGLLIIVISLLAASLSHFFISDQENLHLFRFAIVILGISTGLSFPLRVFDGVLGAHLRFDLKRYIELGEIIFRTGAIVALLEMGYGIYGLAIATAVALIAELGAKVIACLRIDRSLQLGIKFFRLDKLNEMGEFSLVTFINSITNILTNKLDPYVVAIVSNVTTVAYYGVALTLTNYFGEFFRTTQSVLFPLFSQKEGSGDLQGIERWLIFGSKMSTIIATSCGAMVILYGRQFLIRWLGTNFLESYLYTAILIAPMILAYGVFPSVFILNATGKHRLATILDAFRGGLNLALSIVLGYKMGAVGVALGTAIPCIIFDIVLKPHYACRSIRSNSLRFLGIIVFACMKTCILILPVWLLFGRDIQESYVSMATIVAAHLVIIAVIGFFVLLESQERQEITSFVKNYFARRTECPKSV